MAAATTEGWFAKEKPEKMRRREATPLSPYEPRFGGAFLLPAQAARMAVEAAMRESLTPG